MNAPRRLRAALASFTALVALLCASTTLAQSSVWKVTRNGKTLYVGGTIHMLREADFPLPPEFDTAFAASSKLVFETDVSRLQSPEMASVIAAEGMFTDGTTLDRVLTPKAWKTVQDYCAKSGVPLAQMKMMKPWLFTMMIAVLELQKIGVSTSGVDLHYFNRAASSGKTTGELESFERHLQYLTSLGAGKESEMVEKSIEDLNELPAMLERIIVAWRKGDEKHIDEFLLADMRKKYPAIYKSLLTSRNAEWAPKIDALLNTPEVEFILVGAGHLPGPDGLFALLKARGCKIEQLKTNKAK